MLARLTAAVQAVCPGADVATTGGAPSIIYPPGATPEQRAAAAAAVAAFDWSPQAHAAWELAQSTTGGLGQLAASIEPLWLVLRVVFRDLYTQLNDERESRGLPRIQEPDTVARLLASVAAGGGAPLTLP